MTIANLIKFIRSNVDVNQIKDYPVVLTDADIELYLEVVLTRDFPLTLSLDKVTNAQIYPLMLLAKKELYFYLATKAAEKYDLEADGSKLTRDQIFNHYFRMISEVDKIYNQFIKDGGAGGVGNTMTSVEVLLGSRVDTKRNYDLSVEPTVEVITDLVGITICDISWLYTCDHFYTCKVYLSESPIYDEYTREISTEARLLSTYTDSHIKTMRITDLTPFTTYYLAVIVTSQTTLKGVSEITFTTLEE